MAGSSAFCAFWQRAEGPREERLLELLSYGLVALGAVSALLLRFIPMPYGRYSSRRFGWLLPARPAWLLQELPALLVPFALAACIPAWRLPNAVLLSCFILHYVHRCGRWGRRSGVPRALSDLGGMERGSDTIRAFSAVLLTAAGLGWQFSRR